MPGDDSNDEVTDTMNEALNGTIDKIVDDWNSEDKSEALKDVDAEQEVSDDTE